MVCPRLYVTPSACELAQAGQRRRSYWQKDFLADIAEGMGWGWGGGGVGVGWGWGGGGVGVGWGWGGGSFADPYIA